MHYFLTKQQVARILVLKLRVRHKVIVYWRTLVTMGLCRMDRNPKEARSCLKLQYSGMAVMFVFDAGGNYECMVQNYNS